MGLQKVLSGKRITLPSRFCRKYKIKVGDYVDVDQRNGLLVVAVDLSIKERRGNSYLS